MDLSAGVALTYANDRHMDGAGAQLQRIYGIYAISRFCNLPYVHSPLLRIGYQGLAVLERNSSLSEPFTRQFIVTWTFSSDWISNAKRIGEFTLVRILFPYSVTDRNPGLRVRQIRFSDSTQQSAVFRLALHVRRGKEFVIDSERRLPNSFYVS